MRFSLIVLLLTCLAGCTPHEDPLPPVVPMPDDLSTWTAPEPWMPPPPPPVPVAPLVRPASPNEQVYAYEPSKEYEVLVPLGVPTDVVLEEGEHFTALVEGDRTPVADGEVVPWEFKQAGTHVFVTATQPGLRQGVVIATDKRTYYLTVKSVGKSKVRAVRWTYPPAPAPVVAKEPSLLPDPTVPQRFHVGYNVSVEGDRPEFVPFVLDNGRKTFLVFSPLVLYSEIPLIRERGPQGPAVLNTRLIGHTVVLDKLAGRLELRYGTGEQAQVVQIVRGGLQTIICPGHPQCPLWTPQGGPS